MPGNLVFNYTAEQLKAQVYGVTSGGTLTGLLVDDKGKVQVGGSITVTIKIEGNGFVSSHAILTTSDDALTNTTFNFDTSQYKKYSFCFKNIGTADAAVRAQVSPATAEDYYVDDRGTYVVPGQIGIIMPTYFMNYTRIKITGISQSTVTVEAYFNGQY